MKIKVALKDVEHQTPNIKPSDEGDDDAPKHVHIEKISNGFLLHAHGKGMDDDHKHFASKFAQVPGIMQRILKISKDKNARQIQDMVETKEED